MFQLVGLASDWACAQGPLVDTRLAKSSYPRYLPLPIALHDRGVGRSGTAPYGIEGADSRHSSALVHDTQSGRHGEDNCTSSNGSDPGLRSVHEGWCVVIRTSMTPMPEHAGPCASYSSSLQ